MTQSDDLNRPLLASAENGDDNLAIAVKKEATDLKISDDSIEVAAIFARDAFDGNYRDEAPAAGRSRWWYCSVYLLLKTYVGPAVILLWLLPLFQVSFPDPRRPVLPLCTLQGQH